MAPMRAASSELEFDVAILGGALGGAATAWLLLREDPSLRVAVVEKSEAFGRRVGEATVEISAFFLSKVLRLTQHLNERHLNKQGMRFWFQNQQTRDLPDCSEIGGRFMARLPAWQVDRSVLDEEVLTRAVAAGATLFRPAKARRVRLEPGGTQVVELESAGGGQELRARWVVDASGFTALLARQEGWLRRNEAHPTTAVWTRWRGVTDLDGEALAARHPEWSEACHGVRATATNHLMGDGWWAWVIPLKGGDYSVGTVFDTRRVHFPEGGTLSARLHRFLTGHPVGATLLGGATPVEGDAHWRSNLAYWSERQAGDGYVLVGDAAGFLDPFYSPGMDWLSYSVTRAVALVVESRRGGDAAGLAAAHQADFSRAYRYWFEALYRDKYDAMGDYELMRIAFELDLGMYFLGVVSQPLRNGREALRRPVFTGPRSEWPYRFMALYNRRLAWLGRDRRRRGTFGRHNHGERHLVNGFLPDGSAGRLVLRSVVRWLWLELTEGRAGWFGPAEEGGVAGMAGQAETGSGAAARAA